MGDGALFAPRERPPPYGRIGASLRPTTARLVEPTSGARLTRAFGLSSATGWPTVGLGGRDTLSASAADPPIRSVDAIRFSPVGRSTAFSHSPGLSTA